MKFNIVAGGQAPEKERNFHSKCGNTNRRQCPPQRRRAPSCVRWILGQRSFFQARSFGPAEFDSRKRKLFQSTFNPHLILRTSERNVDALRCCDIGVEQTKEN